MISLALHHKRISEGFSQMSIRNIMAFQEIVLIFQKDFGPYPGLSDFVCLCLSCLSHPETLPNAYSCGV